VKIIRHYWTKPIVHPFAKTDPRLDPKLTQAATLAAERANLYSQAQCWHYVKHALCSAGVIGSYPKTPYAADVGDELMRSYGSNDCRSTILTRPRSARFWCTGIATTVMSRFGPRTDSLAIITASIVATIR
jgi:hypothetical protein